MAGHTDAQCPEKPGHGAHQNCPAGHTPESAPDPLPAPDPPLLAPELPLLPELPLAPELPLLPELPPLVPLLLAPEDDPPSWPEDEPPLPPEDIEPTPPASSESMKSLPPQPTTPTTKVAATARAHERGVIARLGRDMERGSSCLVLSECRSNAWSIKNSVRKTLDIENAREPA